MSCGHERTARTDNRRFVCGQADIEYVCKILQNARTMQGLVFVADIEEKYILQGLLLDARSSSLHGTESLAISYSNMNWLYQN